MSNNKSKVTGVGVQPAPDNQTRPDSTRTPGGTSLFDVDNLMPGPEFVAKIQPAEVPILLARVASVHLALWARMQAPPADVVGARRTRPEEPDTLLAVEQAAPMMGVTPRWLYRHWKMMPFARKLAPKVLRFDRTGLERWVASKRP